MNPTGKAGKPRDKPPVLKGKSQYERFVETAKSLEADESGEAFERAMKVIVPHQINRQSSPSSAKKKPLVQR